MFARLYANNTNIQTAYSEISKVITGEIANPALLTAFNPTTSIIVNAQPSNWKEYTSVGVNNQVTGGSVIWFRQRNKSGRWKYAGLCRTSSPATAHKGLVRHYVENTPSILATNIGTASNTSEVYGASTEYTIAAGQGYLVIATRLVSSAYFTDVHMWLEYPENDEGIFNSLPNHLMYRHFSTGTSYATDATSDLAYSTGIVEIARSGNSGVQVLNGGINSPSTQHGTLKPNYFTSFSNTVDGSGAFVSYPIVSLFIESTRQGFLDCSTLTGIWGAGHSIANYGDSITIDGIEYAFIKANACLSYIIPKK